MNFEEKKISSQIKYDGKILRLEVDKVLLPDGTESVRECVRHSGGAAVLLIIDNKVALVRQYRYLYGKEIYEIPAGKMEEGEGPAAAALRELEEETGYRAKKVTPLLKIYPSPGYTDEIIHVFLAEDCEKVEQRLDDGEFLDVVHMPVGEVLNLIDGGEICDAKTVAAVYKYIAIVNSSK